MNKELWVINGQNILSYTNNLKEINYNLEEVEMAKDKAGKVIYGSDEWHNYKDQY